MFGGVVWNKWSGWFQDNFVAAQNPDGSWPVPGALAAGRAQGAVFDTTLILLMLESYRYHMPTQK